MRVLKDNNKKIITKSNLPDTDYVINPYTGCTHACSYCYASFMGRFIGEDIEDWGKYLYVKNNAVELMRSELPKLIRKNEKNGKDATIFLSSVTDAWQPIEVERRLTRGILEVLVQHGYSGTISCLTKSPLITRDIDLLGRLPNTDVGMTITSASDEVSRFLEPKVPNATLRLRALKQLNDAGLRTYAFVGPVSPYYIEHPEKLDDLFKAISETGTKEVYVEHLNLSSSVKIRMEIALKDESKEVRDLYLVRSKQSQNKVILNCEIERLVGKYGLVLRLGKVIDHGRG